MKHLKRLFILVLTLSMIMSPINVFAKTYTENFSNEEKQVWNAMTKYYKNFDKRVKNKTMTQSDLETIHLISIPKTDKHLHNFVRYFERNNPQYFYMHNGGNIKRGENHYINITHYHAFENNPSLYYKYTKKYNKLIDEVDNYVNEKYEDLKDKEYYTALFEVEPEETEKLIKAQLVYDFIEDNIKYEGSEYDQSIISIFKEGSGVCSSYAALFKVMCNKYDIDCVVVWSNKGEHAWNKVKLFDEWFNSDTMIFGYSDKKAKEFNKRYRAEVSKDYSPKATKDLARVIKDLVGDEYDRMSIIRYPD